MKIAVFGWYGNHNAGDERIKDCLHRFLMGLGGINSVDFYDLHKSAINGKTDKYDSYDLIIIGGGGLILSQSNYHDFINGINTKIITAGISVEHQKLTGNALKFARSLIDKSEIMLVRDQASAAILKRYDLNSKVRVSSDLTFLKPYESVNISNVNKIGINLLPKPAHIKYSTLCNPFLDFAIRQLHRFGFRNSLKFINFEDLVKALKSRYKVCPIPLYYKPQTSDLPIYQINDVEFLKNYFEDVPDTFSDKMIDECSLFLSMRLHGAIFAVQKGIPIISLAYLPKNRNFMREVGLEEFVFENIDTLKINEAIASLQKNRSIVQEKMLCYKDKATKNIQQDLIAALNKAT